MLSQERLDCLLVGNLLFLLVCIATHLAVSKFDSADGGSHLRGGLDGDDEFNHGAHLYWVISRTRPSMAREDSGLDETSAAIP